PDSRGRSGPCPFVKRPQILARRRPGAVAPGLSRRTIELLGPHTHESPSTTSPRGQRLRVPAAAAVSGPVELHCPGNLSEVGSVPVAPVLPVHEVARR